MRHPFRLVVFAVLLGLPRAQSALAQDLPSRWEDLTASDWPRAMEASAKTCVLPFGVMEKHGPHLPIGSDLIQARELANRATKQEYAVVFPDYYFGQINEARHQPGAVALPARLVWDLLEATCDEIARNGFKRIVILNQHGGNPELIYFFGQTRLEKRRDYALYFFTPQRDEAFDQKLAPLMRSDPAKNLHAGEGETSTLLYMRPDLPRMGQARNESGEDQKRLALPPDVWTPIWWFARFPNHYSGEGDKGNAELGQALVQHAVETFATALKAIKADTRTLELQNEFFDRVDRLGRAPVK